MANSRGRHRKPSRGGKGNGRLAETSVPTGRAAYAETRAWLLKTHGPVCAYCGLTFAARTLTLDHVTPRRGQSAYDRRDNLVLACPRCNTGKADKSFLAWVLGARARAKHLFTYGQHLSDGILEILRPIVGNEVTLPAPRPAAKKRRAKEVFAPLGGDDGESPYNEASPYLDDAPVRRPPPATTTGAAPSRRSRAGRTRRSATRPRGPSSE